MDDRSFLLCRKCCRNLLQNRKEAHVGRCPFLCRAGCAAGAADPGVGKLSGFQKIAEGTPGSKIISLIDDPVGEVFADIKVIGQRGSTLTEQSIL